MGNFFTKVGKVVGGVANTFNPFGGGSVDESSNVVNQIPAEQRELWKTQTEALKPFLELSKRVPGMINEDLISKYQGTLQKSPEEASLAGTLTSLGERAAQPFSYEAYLEPLRREFMQTIAPEIRASALRVGAPGGSGEMESMTRAGERYAESAASAFERARQTENQSIGLAGALAQDAAAGGELSRALAQASVLAPLSLTQMGLGMAPNQPQFTSLGTTGTSNQSKTLGLMDVLTKGGQAMESGAGGLGSIYALSMLMSDRRLKGNVKFIGTHKGYNIYSFDYIWGMPGVGVMADEVEKVNPSAVFEVNGFKAVDYRRL